MSVSNEEGRWQLSMVEKLVGAVLIGMLGWMAITVQQTAVDVAVIKSDLANGRSDRFTAQEGRSLGDRLNDAEDRIGKLEERVMAK